MVIYRYIKDDYDELINKQIIQTTMKSAQITELYKTYEAQSVEQEIYRRWEESGYFNPDNLDLPADAPTYTIVLPPPNITAKLHLGHAAMLAIEDVLIRFHRMRGFRTLWVPGTDHAAIATQNAVEKKIFAETGKTRHDLGREELIEEVWTFLRKTQSTILAQTRVMGASLDWSREAFTLDAPRQKAVTQMFIDMERAGVIYRGERVVNWCPRCHSTLADDEVKHAEQTAQLYTFRYSNDFPFAISTTRPETKLGDTAVAVNPKDKRYAQYIGQTFTPTFCGVPLTIKIIADRHVDMEFGTGALGVTPAHSMVDWQMAEQNDIPVVKVIDENGNIHTGFAQFTGLTAIEARAQIVARLRTDNLIEHEEEITNNLSVCYRCDTPIEPLPSKQWFVDVDKKLARFGGKSMKDKAIEVAQSKEIEFIPARFTKQYIDWMENLHNWCISRQIWFGHRIPAWHCTCGEVIVDANKPANCAKCGSAELTQDPDVLDTWFSSGMWTFSTLGWPENFADGAKSGDLAQFHPTQVLETGYEILTLWVSRMIMMSLFAVGEIPFEKVHLHGMVLDAHGKKMSKSKGNGIDPIDVVDKFGTDAVRLSLLIGNTPGNDMRISEQKIQSYRNFVTKLWNIGRYIAFATDIQIAQKRSTTTPITNTDADAWILVRLNNTITTVTEHIHNHQLSNAGEVLRDFTWNDLADWYIEVHKIEKNNDVLIHVFENLLKLWHPFMPFVTEELWQQLFVANSANNSNDENTTQFLMTQTWAKVTEASTSPKTITGVQNFDIVRDIITTIRNIRGTYKVNAGTRIDITIVTTVPELIERHRDVIIGLARVGALDITTKYVNTTESGASAVCTAGTIYAHLDSAIDTAAEQVRLTKEIANAQKYAEGLTARLANEKFISSAPQEIVTAQRETLAQTTQKIAELRVILTEIS